MAKAADKIKTSTRKSYGKITGTHLARAKEQGYTLTPKGLADYMTKLANSGTITKSSWYKLRCAIASTQDYGGYKDAADRLRALKFPEKATPKAKTQTRQDHHGSGFQNTAGHHRRQKRHDHLGVFDAVPPVGLPPCRSPARQRIER